MRGGGGICPALSPSQGSDVSLMYPLQSSFLWSGSHRAPPGGCIAWPCPSQGSWVPIWPEQVQSDVLLGAWILDQKQRRPKG